MVCAEFIPAFYVLYNNYAKQYTLGNFLHFCSFQVAKRYSLFAICFFIATTLNSSAKKQSGVAHIYFFAYLCGVFVSPIIDKEEI